MKKIKNQMFVVGLALMLTLLVGIEASELEYWNSKDFKEEWHVTVTEPGNRFTMEYGYDKWCFNEDYTKTISVRDHTALVSNEKYSASQTKKANKWAKADIIHKGNHVRYGLQW